MKYLALDTETKLIKRDKPIPDLICVSMYAGDNAIVVTHMDAERSLRRFFENPEWHIIGHNIAFDMAVIMTTYPSLTSLVFDMYEQRRIHDTMLREQLIDIFKDNAVIAKSLAKLYYKYKDEKLVKEDTWRLRYAELENIGIDDYPEDAIAYSQRDAVATWEVFFEQQDMLTEYNETEWILNRRRALDVLVDDVNQAAYAFGLHLITTTGMAVDVNAVKKLYDENKEIVDRLKPELEEAGYLVDGVLKQDIAKERIRSICAELGVVPKITKHGNIAIDAAACKTTGDPLLVKRSEYITAMKMLTTYYKPLSKCSEDKYLTTRFNLAKTGRTTSSAPSRPLVGTNLQNAPRKKNVRECIIPRPGHVFFAADLGAAELHTLAQFCHTRLKVNTVLGNTLNAGKDPHANLGAQLIGMDYETFMTKLKAGDEDVAKARYDAKSANFGFPGGMGVTTFISIQFQQSGKVWNIDDATKLRNTWRRTYTEMNKFFSTAAKVMKTGNRHISRTLYSNRIRKVSTYTQLCNNTFQSPAADGAKQALFGIVRACYDETLSSPLHGCRVLNFIHDELLIESPRTHDDKEVAIEFKRLMEYNFNKVTPDFKTSVDVLIMDRWSKDGKQIA